MTYIIHSIDKDGFSSGDIGLSSLKTPSDKSVDDEGLIDYIINLFEIMNIHAKTITTSTIFLQPNLWLCGEYQQKHFSQSGLYTALRKDRYTDFFKERALIYKRICRIICRRTLKNDFDGIIIKDLSDYFKDQDKLCFYDHVHLNCCGVSLISKEIVKSVKREDSRE